LSKIEDPKNINDHAPKRRSEPLCRTATSVEDIRKVYKFE